LLLWLSLSPQLLDRANVGQLWLPPWRGFRFHGTGVGLNDRRATLKREPHMHCRITGIVGMWAGATNPLTWIGVDEAPTGGASDLSLCCLC